MTAKQLPEKQLPAEPLPPLAAIVTGIESTLGSIAAAEMQMQRATLADRVWIGVLCLGAQEHHAMPPEKSGKMGGRGKKGIPRVEHLSTDAVHPQGFLAWIDANVSTCGKSAVYKYMAAARALGLDAWTSEADARALVAQRIAEFDERGTPLSLSMLAAQGKLPDPEPEPERRGPDVEAIKTDAIQTLFTFMDEVVNVKDALTPVESDTVINRIAEILRRLTGKEWSPEP